MSDKSRTRRETRRLLSAVGFRVPGLFFRASIFGFQFSGLGPWVSGLEFRVSGLGLRVSAYRLSDKSRTRRETSRPICGGRISTPSLLPRRFEERRSCVRTVRHPIVGSTDLIMLCESERICIRSRVYRFGLWGLGLRWVRKERVSERQTSSFSSLQMASGIRCRANVAHIRQIMALTFMQKSLKPFELFSLRSEAVRGHTLLIRNCPPLP